MANFRYAIGTPWSNDATKTGDFTRMYSAVPATNVYSSSAQSDYDDFNVTNEHIKTSWRSDTAGTEWVSLRFASSVTPAAFLVEGCNVDEVVLTAHDASSMTSPTSAAAFDLTQNDRTGRYGRLILTPDWPAQYFWGIKIASATATVTDGASHFEIGRITPITTLNTLTQNIAIPYSVTVGYVGGHTKLTGGNVNSYVSSDAYCVFDMSAQWNRNTAGTEADARKLARVKPTERVVFYENRTADTNLAHAYMTYPVGDVEVTESDWPILEMDLTLREAI